MSVDDQLFKQDGTHLTRVDVLILRFARVLATSLFAEADDETYDRALRRMQRLAGVVGVTGAVIRGVSGDSFSLYTLSFLGVLYFLQASFLTCNGRGTCISRAEKMTYLFFVGVPVVLGSATVGFLLSSPVLSLWHLGYVVWCIGFFLAMLGPYYVARLGAKPPSRKKAKVPETSLAKM